MKKRIESVFAILLVLIIILDMNFYLKKDKTSQRQNTIKVVDKNKEKDLKDRIESYQKKYNNKDIVAQLIIEDLEINTLITKSKDNQYYLNHDLAGKESALGNAFIDFRNDLPLKDERQINIYSHNSDYDSYREKLPFYKLENYLEKKKFDSSKNVYLYTKEKKLEYEVYAVKIITNDNEHTVLDSNDDTRWNQHLKKLLTDTKYCKGNCALDNNDKLLILQTCNYQPRNSYILLILKKI